MVSALEREQLAERACAPGRESTNVTSNLSSENEARKSLQLEVRRAPNQTEVHQAVSGACDLKELCTSPETDFFRELKSAT